MRIYTFIKGEDDFGRKKIAGDIYEYSQHYPRSIEDDIHVYYYPTRKTVSIYQVIKETENAIDPDGVFSYVRGEMKNLLYGFPNSYELISYLIHHDEEVNNNIGKKINEALLKLENKLKNK